MGTPKKKDKAIYVIQVPPRDPTTQSTGNIHSPTPTLEELLAIKKKMKKGEE